VFSNVSYIMSSASWTEPEDSVAVQLQLAPVGVGELAERLFVARLCPGECVLGHDRILASPHPRRGLDVTTPAGPERHRSFRAARGVSTSSKHQRELEDT